MSAYVKYVRDDYDESIIALNRYIELHPNSPDTPYAYYLKGSIFTNKSLMSAAIKKLPPWR